ncbi:D-alanyl-D-alanine carboxypeptidase [Arthrobacter pascens]|uniref:serine hydrolase domain-containing protein n=1 Tax=Arthrobacter pascens TaxID=1677 RepID=UPI00278D6BE1|nr:serine hydrolase [Arthrobacter pascens]MDQ0680382.1 D-alanyl-D-alanine carboxypeptidase [Arthrobacter pascens]
MLSAFTRVVWLRLAALAIATMVGSSLGACTGAPDPPDQQSPTAKAFVPVLERYSEDVLEAGAPAVFIQMKSRVGEWSKAAGVRSLENQEPVQLTDQVHVGDITSTMVAVSVMKLVEEGKVRLDDPITQYLPELENVIRPSWPVTVRSLLNHRSGMPNYLEAVDGSEPLSHENRLALAGTLPWKHNGSISVYIYSRSDYAALALLVEKLRGRALEEVLHVDIAEPLGLQDTLMTGSQPGPQKMVHGYILLDGGGREDTTLPAILIGSADSGMISTVVDLNTFTAALIHGKLLKPSTVLEMLAPNQHEYGLGLMKRRDACSNNSYVGHFGQVQGYVSVALTSADGSRQLAMALAYPPETWFAALSPSSSTEDFNRHAEKMLEVAVEALNLAC